LVALASGIAGGDALGDTVPAGGTTLDGGGVGGDDDPAPRLPPVVEGGVGGGGVPGVGAPGVGAPGGGVFGNGLLTCMVSCATLALTLNDKP